MKTLCDIEGEISNWTLNKNNINCYFHDLCAKKMFEQKRFAGRHLLTFESQKLNYFGKKVGSTF